MAKPDLIASLESSFNDGQYSDFIIACEGVEYKVHKVIICPQSTFFEKVCNSSFKEGKSGVINLEDDSWLVRAMLYYLYTGNYACTEDCTCDGEVGRMRFTPEVFNHVRLYELAERLDIPGLRALSKQKFNAFLTANWDNKAIPRAIREVYEDIPPRANDLRESIIEFCTRNLYLLVTVAKPAVGRSEFAKLLTKVPEFRTELTDHLTHRRIWPTSVDKSLVLCVFCGTANKAGRLRCEHCECELVHAKKSVPGAGERSEGDQPDALVEATEQMRVRRDPSAWAAWASEEEYRHWGR